MSDGPITYLSVCGLSSVGKKTLIRRLLQDAPGLRERFGIEKQTLAAFGYAFLPIDEIHTTRAECALHQWQIATDSLVEELRTKQPQAEHRVVVLWRPWEQNHADWVRAYAATDPAVASSTPASIERAWTDLILPRFHEGIPRQLGLRVELVDASTPDYRELEHWPGVTT